MAEIHPILRRHRLAHIPTLQIDPVLFTTRFAAGCRTANCNAACCKWGVWIDVEERDRILANAERVRQMMEVGQDPDPTHWFDPGEEADPDFPSGRAIGTAAPTGCCVFLDGAGRCSLQLASAASGGDLQLKPFFCRLYPLTLLHGVLTLDDELVEAQTRCCAASVDGQSSVFDVCRDELDLIVDPQGLHELQRLADAHT